MFPIVTAMTQSLEVEGIVDQLRGVRGGDDVVHMCHVLGAA